MFGLWTKKLALEARINSLEQENIRLSDRNRDLQTENLILSDRLRASVEDRDHLWKLVENSLGNERFAYQMHINREWQKMGQPAPYPDAPHKPESEVPKLPKDPFINRPMIGSEMAAIHTKRFLDKYFNNESQTEQ